MKEQEIKRAMEASRKEPSANFADRVMDAVAQPTVQRSWWQRVPWGLLVTVGLFLVFSFRWAQNEVPELGLRLGPLGQGSWVWYTLAVLGVALVWHGFRKVQRVGAV